MKERDTISSKISEREGGEASNISLLSIRGVLDAGKWIEDPSLVKQEFLITLSESVFETKEDCGVDKSPGPDDFTFDFYRRFWNIIGNDVVEAVQFFFQHVIAKVLANRLVTVLGDIVSEVQSAFVAERQILDGPFILSEVLQWCKSKRKQSFIFKIDFEKAYDSRMSSIFVGSVVVNGSPTKEFQFFRGLKQGDTLSPFLFILFMKSLHISFQKMVDANMFKGIELSSSMVLSHMFYADDVVFMGHWSNSNIKMIIYVLKCFERASGLCINLSKRKILGIAVDKDKVEQAASRIGCGILDLPFSYLGSNVWGPIPIYRMSIFKVPLKVLQGTESLRNRFFNGVDSGSKKSIWIKWNKVLVSKETGGLGVSSLYALNRAFLLKWVWRFITQKNILWSKVITAIYGVDGNIGSNLKSGYRSIWRDILQVLTNVKNQGSDFLAHIQKRLGNGGDTSFWEETWLEDKALKYRYPRLFTLEMNKHISVADKLAQECLGSSFRRAPRGGLESFQLSGLISKVGDIRLVNKSDRWIWDLESSGSFSVASMRKEIDLMRLDEVSSQTRWIKEVPIKLNVLAWKVKLDALPSRLNISRRGMDINNIICPICDGDVESSRHIFFACHVAKNSFRKICLWWNVNFVEISSYEEAIVRLPDPKRKTLDEKGIDCIFVGYAEHFKAYRLKDIIPNSVESQRDDHSDDVPSETPEPRRGCKWIFKRNMKVDGTIDKFKARLVLEGYSDASWINHVEDSSSTSGWVFLLGEGVISWAFKKQTCITGSTMESKFTALATAGKEAKWLRNLIHKIPIWPKPIAPMSIRRDSAPKIAKGYNQIFVMVRTQRKLAGKVLEIIRHQDYKTWFFWHFISKGFVKKIVWTVKHKRKYKVLKKMRSYNHTTWSTHSKYDGNDSMRPFFVAVMEMRL
nr:RNA-directed DNA polymerase, eukaryota, reverse transcriptase zinc-binding domain protein [Tanacetum cinerariifolium]